MVYANGSRVLLLNRFLLSSLEEALAGNASENLSCSVRGLTLFKEILCPMCFLIYICKIHEIDQIFPLNSPIRLKPPCAEQRSRFDLVFGDNL